MLNNWTENDAERDSEEVGSGILSTLDAANVVNISLHGWIRYSLSKNYHHVITETGRDDLYETIQPHK